MYVTAHGNVKCSHQRGVDDGSAFMEYGKMTIFFILLFEAEILLLRLDSFISRTPCFYELHFN